MSWHGIEGHDEVVERFRRALDRGRLASTFLFVGPGGIGKRKFALKLAQALLCQTRPAELLDPCEHCPACAQVLAGTHPDLDVVSKPPDKSFIPVAALIGDKEHRMHEGLCHKIGLKPFAGGRKVAIIDDADDLNQEGANALLKTLEEPPPRSVLILIGTSADRQLPTIRSRSQMIRFRPLDNETVARLLLENTIASDPQEAARLAAHSGGSVARASELADPALWNFRGELLAALASFPADSVAAAKNVIEFVDSAGKDAGPRRARGRLLAGFAIDFFRLLLRRLNGMTGSDDAELAALVERAQNNGWTEDAAAAALDRCLETLGQIDRNANQTTMIECWIDDLAEAASQKSALGRL
jgi:DNA polymerase III subunit delta'